MATARADRPLLEFARRRRFVALIAAIAVAAGGVAAAALVRPRAERVEGHAFAVPASTERIITEVLNATDRPGLARAATRALRRRGVDVVFFGNADEGTPSDSTRVIVRRGHGTAAGERVAEALGQGIVVVEIDTLRRVDVTVVLGADYRRPAAVRP